MGGNMKKLGLYLCASVLVSSFFCFADTKVLESPLGPVVAVERKFVLDPADCSNNFKKRYTGDNKEYLWLSCRVELAPASDEEEGLSSSLNKIDYDQRKVLLTEIRGSKIWIDLDDTLNGYEIETNGWNKDYYPELEKITKEDFLKAAQPLFEKFPEITVKLIKVVH